MSAPFGIELGSSLYGLDVIDTVSEGRYIVAAPRPHPMFETYVVQVADQYGVVWIKGLGRTVDNDAFGYGVRSQHEEVTAQLTKRYGPAEVSDWIVPDAIWTEPRDWVMSLTQNERFYSARWERSSGGLPFDIDVVYLGVGTDGTFASWLVLEYAGVDLAAADAVRQDDLSDLL